MYQTSMHHVSDIHNVPAHLVLVDYVSFRTDITSLIIINFLERFKTYVSKIDTDICCSVKCVLYCLLSMEKLIIVNYFVECYNNNAVSKLIIRLSKI